MRFGPLPTWKIPIPFERLLLALLARRAEARGDLPDQIQRLDALTGLLNRRAFGLAVRTAGKNNIDGSLAFFDLDGFKRINDAFGHDIGDQVLREVASRLAATLPRDAMVARMGGDEFCIFVPGTAETGLAVAEACLDAARMPMQIQGHGIALTLSAGFAPLPVSVGLQDTLNAVDAAMFVAKTSGRDRIQVFTEKAHGAIGARRDLAAAVTAMQEKNMSLQQLADTDALTGLRNRRALDKVLEHPCGLPTARWPQCAVAFLDIDLFGDYNHHYSDSKGDEVLRNVAWALEDAARMDDLVFRKGGEEFLVVLPNTSEADAHAVAERFRRAVEALAIEHSASDVAPVVTVTVGVAASSQDQQVTVNELMDRAAVAALRAKERNERNAVHRG